MFGLIISTVHLKLPFTFVKSIVVSTTTTDSREGWKYIDALPDDAVCDPTASSPSSPLPIALHYCSRYLLGKVSRFVSRVGEREREIQIFCSNSSTPPTT